jgi:RHS repeat-associated protein
LGNVLTTVSDKKLAVDDGNGNAAYYLADISSVSDYYPFGMAMPDHKYNQGDYQFGFNGMEGDEEIKGEGNSYTTEFRQYDTRLGRWLSLDPLAMKFASWNPYNFVFGSPITMIDPNGKEPIYDMEGDFLGTDDQGLQGEAIVMVKSQFTQGMSNSDALEKGDLLTSVCESSCLSNETLNKINTHYSELPSRPDYDGGITIKEGVEWAKSHPNLKSDPDDFDYSLATKSDALYMDVSKLYFGYLKISDFAEVGVEQPVNLLKTVSFEWKSKATVYALGRTHMTLVSTADGGIVEVSNGSHNAFDWSMGGGNLRESFIIVEKARRDLDDSHGFPIFVYGQGRLNKEETD